MDELVQRVRALLAGIQYLTLATADAEGRPWCSTVWFTSRQRTTPAGSLDLELIWLSLPDAQHSRNLHVRPEVGISIFDSGQPAGTGDGLQFAARAREIPSDELDAAAAVFSAGSLAAGGGPWTRAQLQAPARSRLYLAQVEAAFLLGDGARRAVATV